MNRENQILNILEEISIYRFQSFIKLLIRSKVGYVFLMVVVFILPQAEFGPNDHRDGALHFIWLNGPWKGWIILKSFEKFNSSIDIFL